MIQGSALVGDLQAQTDLVGIFTEDLLVRHNDETGRIAVGIIDPFFQNFQSVGLSRVFAGDSCLGFILFLRYFNAAKALFCILICCQSCSARYLALCIRDWGWE